ncbi:lipase family protein [Nocardia halotolerans]|uniref:Lipase family protein n=1 Tax=Nocardia halotolerans TaxID=1755878 RepID=A0ABV8VFE0_9NOCA
MYDVISKAGRVLAGALTLVAVVAGVPATAQAAPEHPGRLVSHTAQPPGWGEWSRASIVEYSTEAATGGTTKSAGLLLLPDAPAPEGGYPVVAWDHGTSGLAPRCGLTTSKAARERPLLQSFLDQGWAVVAPDYLGLSAGADTVHPYLHTRSEATATIDVVRAARAAEPSLSPSWSVVGGSQGGHAALATGNLAADYAPELDFRGTVALAPESQFEQILSRLDPKVPNLPVVDRLVGPFAGMLAGLRATRPDLDVNGTLSARGRQVVDAIATSCVHEFDAVVDGASLGALLARPMESAGVGAALRDYMMVPTVGYRQPILIAHGATDMVVPLPMTLALLGQMRSAGTEVEFAQYPGGHEQIAAESHRRVLDFVGGLFAA